MNSFCLHNLEAFGNMTLQSNTYYFWGWLWAEDKWNWAHPNSNYI